MAVVNDIATALKTVVDSITGMPTSDIRKSDVFQSRDTAPLALIAYQDETSDEWAALGAGGSDQGSIGMAYEFAITIYRVVSGDISSGLSTDPDILEDFRQAVNKGTLTGASTVWGVEWVQRPIWESDVFATGGQAARARVKVNSGEARNG
jgi:hypothetical protein